MATRVERTEAVSPEQQKWFQATNLHSEFRAHIEKLGRLVRPTIKQLLFGGGFDQYIHWELSLNFDAEVEIRAIDPSDENDIVVLVPSQEKRFVLPPRYSVYRPIPTDETLSYCENLNEKAKRWFDRMARRKGVW